MDVDMDIKENDVVQGQTICQTKDAKWLCISSGYRKFHRPNMYDIGGTNIDDVVDFWFTMETEKVKNIFLLHVFITSLRENEFLIQISSNNELTYSKKDNAAILTAGLHKYSIKHNKDLPQSYLCTYSFDDSDVQTFKNYDLYIAISFSITESPLMNEIVPPHDFRALLNDPVGADFIMESSDGTKFQTHKILLTSVCDVFKAMLRDDTSESINSYVKLIDVSKEDLSCMLEFIYTGTVKDVDNNNFFNLLMLADRYNLEGLKELSEFVLSNQITSENVLDMLTVADTYNSQKLKLVSLKFLKQNPTVLHSSMFEELKSVELVRQICKFIVPI